MASHPHEQPDKHYDTPYWLKYADIEHRIIDGISYEDRIKMETDFVMEHGDLDLKPGDKVLDLASGTGDHAMEIAARTGANIKALEYTDTLVAIAKRKLEERTNAIQGETRDQVLKIDFGQGDYTRLKGNEKIGATEKFKAITCLGSSFLYLPNHEVATQALKDFNDLLEPGGKLLLQWREKRPFPPDQKRLIGSKQWSEEQGYIHEEPEAGSQNSVYFDKQGKKRTVVSIMGKKSSPGEDDGYKTLVLRGYDKKPSLFSRFKKSKNSFQPYPDIPEENGGLISKSTFSRVYVGDNGDFKEEEPTTVIDYLDTKHFSVLKRMLEEAGFKNIKLLPENTDGVFLSQDGFRRIFGVVAEK